METIAAIATAVGEGGVGVIRLSGPASLSCVEKMFVRKRKGPWKPHQMVLGVCLGEDGSVLDEGLAVWMPEGRSFTGEEVVELHMHGGRLHLMQLLRRVLSLGVRLAEPGEFSKRAYFHGKMDLTQAEAVADLIAANNAQALHVARQHLQGKLRTALQELAERSLSIAMRVESWIDFPEEFDPALDASVKLIWDDLHAFAQEVRVLEESYAQGCRLREGWSLLLLGPPNAGKSSLFNALCGEQRALVTSMSGTTRDLLEVQMEWAGIQLRLVDSAGLRALSHESLDTVTHERVEQMGMERALTFAQDVQLLLVVLDRAQELTPQELEPIRQACQQKPHLLILNKSDLSTRLSKESLQGFQPMATFDLSCTTGEGLPALQEWLRVYMEEQASVSSLIITNERHFQSLKQASAALAQALEQGMALGPEFLAEDCRTARQALRALVGELSSEDVLEAIFSKFCIGK